MKANELMIGDWVRISNFRTNIPSWRGRNVRVECLPDDTRIRTYFTKKYYDNYSVDKEDEIEPIPLTADILEKNGFERDPESGWMIFVLDCGEISWLGTILNIRGDNTEYLNLVDCMFVHELQHALRLCGLDELADNFKV